MGPQHKGFRSERQRTTQVGVGPQHKGFRSERQRTTQVGVAPTQRNAVNISTSKAS
ncbi:hypothetical protein [Staphylococcus lugdunensis]|uniref:hypothetical protein n=1 Tax=Staphylococcus lugdunensis TaxID=28035 RepID=UPI001F5A373C|nr:hypothetical protein [Staphylococcus lugdunensis]MCI2765311.1 hypothetical protein [Staphylococcus lugdunensis]MCI2801807.1 hypothetical protein [Staphylococcus lugdunensis]